MSTPSKGHPASRFPRPSGRLRLATLLLVLPLLAGLFGGPLGATPVVRGDDMSQAIAQQQALQAKIAAQKAAAKQLAADQAALNVEIASTQTDLARVNGNLAALRSRIDTIAGQVAKVKARYDALVVQLAGLERQLAVIQVGERIKESQLEERKALLAARVRAAYRTDSTSMLETVLSAQSFTDVLNDVSFYMDMGTQDQQLALQIGQDRAALLTLQQNVSAARDQTDQLRQQAAAQKAQLDKQMAALQAARQALQRLQAEIAAQLEAQQAAWARLAANKARVEAAAAAAAAELKKVNAQIAALAAEAAARGNIPSRYNGTLIWPMGGEITQNFGCTGFWAEPPADPAWGYGYCAHFHTGIDIVAPCGTPIHAAGAGMVVWAGYMPAPDGAYDVEIAHSGSLLTLYGHMLPTGTVSYGQYVGQGQVIGYEGSTGNSTGCHLHWAVYSNGIPVNPRLYL